MDTWDLLFSSSVLSLAFYFHLLSLSVQINHPPQIVKETVGLVVICFKCTFKKHILTVKGDVFLSVPQSRCIISLQCVSYHSVQLESAFN